MTGPAAAEHLWLPRWRTRHTRATLLLLGTLVAIALIGPVPLQPALAVQITALVAAVAIFGVPHGALDPLVGRHWLAPRLGPRWWAPFHAAYVLLAAVVVVGWIRLPAATLVAFLVASAVHFGLGDVARLRAARGFAWAEIFARGAAPIAVPALAHPDAVRQAFAWVAPGASAEAITAVVVGSGWCARWLVLPGCFLFALAHLIAASRVTRRGSAAPPNPRSAAHVTDALECLAVPAVAALLPPFCAFLAYFCLLHSARHALSLAATLDPVRPGRAWPRFARAALPAAVRVLFAGLAALTAPHMILTAAAGEPTRLTSYPPPAR